MSGYVLGTAADRGSAVPCRALLTAVLVLGSAFSPRLAGAEDVVVDATRRYQTIEGWGTSLMFWNRSSTPYRAPAWRRAYRDLGLNILRINMNKEVLVDSSGDMTVPVLLGEDIRANVDKMHFDNAQTRVYGDMAVWLAKNALEPERVRITGSVWSPPHWMKGPTGMSQHHVARPNVSHATPWLSRGTWGDSIGGRLLQDPENLEQFARYIAAWIKGFEAHYGVPIYAASIQNEVSFENPFDSVTYVKGSDGKRGQWWQYASALAAVRGELQRHRIGTKIMGPHAAHVGKRPRQPSGLWDQFQYIAAVKAHEDPTLIDFIWAYNSNGYLDPSEDGVKMWAAYLHGTRKVPGDWPSWAQVPGVAQDAKSVWVSEAGGAQRDWRVPPGAAGYGAISVAQKMHNALVHANASAYVYWQMSDAEDQESSHALLGKAHLAEPVRSKKYAAFKHFSRYVRPGAVRVDAHFTDGRSSTGGRSGYDTEHALNLSAYVHDEDGTVTLVFVNMRHINTPVSLQLARGLEVDRLAMYVSTERSSFEAQKPLAVLAGTTSLQIPAHSIVTLHGALSAREESRAP